MDDIATTEFLMTGYVTGSNIIYYIILYSGNKELQAGEYLIYYRIDKSVKVNRYSDFTISKELSFDKKNALNKLD
ncbi:hypothetical protein I2483_12845 [Sporosarcina sp. E16_3]|uniref:hypothetical protein n=1 Tax=Sporosarcina sp. E16_3 TaxID=2789293 RepID=UPI001A91916C|nr:hypothetical protein [Sporosarcina sp. E16_3]MBO0602547.1 hypothetical protein [Sporosarcina sp. E16_3]